MITLGLNIIVGANESMELERCLKSAVDKYFFDQIVITVTTGDKEVRAVAEKYTEDVHYFKWINDFGSARQFCASKTKTDYIMWLDADDVIPEAMKKSYPEIKENIEIAAEKSDIDVVLIPYKVELASNGQFLQQMLRDRVFKRASMKWDKRVHEQLKHVIEGTRLKSATIQGVAVEHYPQKHPEAGLRRNIKILQEEYAVNPKDFHYAFYYARDLSLIKDYDKSIEIFDYIIKERIGNAENLYTAAYNIALYYIYDEDSKIRPDGIKKGETYTRIAMSFGPEFAEPCVLLGDIYYFKGEERSAIRMFKTALSKRMDGRGIKLVPYYEAIPTERLSKIFMGSDKIGMKEQALYYNRIALYHFPEEKELLKRYNVILNEICEGRPDMKGAIR